MALLFIIAGIALLIAAFRNTQGDLGTLLAGDAAGFLKWAAAIVVIGALGFIPNFRTASRLLLALVLIVIVIVNQGAFAKFQQAIQGSLPAAPVPQEPSLAGTPTVDVQLGGGGSSSAASTATSAVGTALKAIPLIGGLF